MLSIHREGVQSQSSVSVVAFRKAGLKFHSLGFQFSKHSDQPVKVFSFPSKYVDTQSHQSFPFYIRSSPVTTSDASYLTATM